VIAAVGLNSATPDDRIGALALSVFDTLLAHGVISPPAGPVRAGSPSG
jgi:hypothetical protein